MSQETKDKRLARLDDEQDRMHQKVTDARALIAQCEQQIDLLAKEREWLAAAPVRPALGDTTQALATATQEGQQ